MNIFGGGKFVCRRLPPRPIDTPGTCCVLRSGSVPPLRNASGMDTYWLDRSGDMEVTLSNAGFPTRRHAENELVVRAKAPQEAGGFIQLAELLRKIKKEDSGWFVQAFEAAGIKRRRAFALVKVDEVFGQGVVDRDRLARIGWSKLAQIASHVSDNKENMETLLSDAERMTARELEIALSRGVELDKSRTLTFTLSEADYKAVEQALVACGAEQNGRGLSGKEQALVKLATNHVSSKPLARG